MEKRIETVELPVSEIKNGFGNPRKISSKKKRELEESLNQFGDFGLILIDEKNNLIAGNQRVEILKEHDENTIVLCKRLIGYSESELKAINIKDNTHSGEWDLELLADWMSDIQLDMGYDDLLKNEIEDKSIKEMDLVRFEKYDYVVIACRNEIDYNELTRKLGIDGAKIKVSRKRKMKARAIWYDDMKAQIISKE